MYAGLAPLVTAPLVTRQPARPAKSPRRRRSRDGGIRMIPACAEWQAARTSDDQDLRPYDVVQHHERASNGDHLRPRTGY